MPAYTRRVLACAETHPNFEFSLLHEDGAGPRPAPFSILLRFEWAQLAQVISKPWLKLNKLPQGPVVSRYQY